MAVISSFQPNLCSCSSSEICAVGWKPSSCSLLFLRRICTSPRRRRKGSNGVVRGYMEDSNSISGLASKIIGSLPVVGLVARIFSDEGGVGGDIIDFAEFRRRVGKRCSVNDSMAFFEFQDRRGKAGDPLYVLLCCWLAAVGAGLLKSEEILEGVARLRISDDIEFEEETFVAMMNESRERRAKLRSPAPNIPMEIRAEKALEAIHVCCFGRDLIEEEDEKLIATILCAVFPSVGRKEMDRMVKEKAKRVADGSDNVKIPDGKPLPKEAVDLQMKDLEFLKKGGDFNR
ncbi:photosystem I assembly factor PSA3, chloroplastic [Andrographis paniculata]|uniref:photosystem I assembly factor PSA3, chloroplastic n=1 Tax=Andrographis paniculata TaxID=175694 RepID=UPI0021E92E56|nr:photosystem I assembly factor PSA3, chloroplastic [Andrographis paniculata]